MLYGFSVRLVRPMEKVHCSFLTCRKPRLGADIRDGMKTVTLLPLSSQGMGGDSLIFACG